MNHGLAFQRIHQCKNTDFVNEIICRGEAEQHTLKRPQIIEWLEQNSVRKGNCVESLTNEVAKLCDILARVQRQENEFSTPGGRKWQGTVPFLHVIMCLTEDHVKFLFLNQANVRPRHELDARNSENR
jgi:hypothetical protein